MEWASSVDILQGQITISPATGALFSVDLSQLSTRGLPRQAKSRHTIRVRLQNAQASQELSINVRRALALPCSVSASHRIFHYDLHGRRYIIPALALMRAFFFPSRVFLARMFGPHALDQMGFIDVDSSPPQLKTLTGLMPGVSEVHRAAFRAVLLWLLGYPSARRMAGTIHRLATLGRIDMQLPFAIAHLEVSGISVENAFCVTKCRLLSILPEEKPLYKIDFETELVMQRIHDNVYEVPRSGSGTVQISDTEWNDIRTLIELSPAAFKHFPERDLLNAVLSKLAYGTNWGNIEYPQGASKTVYSAYRKLAVSGCLKGILAILAESRNPTSVASFPNWASVTTNPQDNSL
jgi:hypothetical protein